MSRSSYPKIPRRRSPERSDRYYLLTRLCKIAPLAIEVFSNPRFQTDHLFALSMLREAHTLTSAWLEEVQRELGHRGLLTEDKEIQSRYQQSNNGWMILLIKLAGMQLMSSKQLNKADKHAWSMKMLKEMFHHLEAHVRNVEEEIDRLERKVERRRQRRRRHRHTRSDKNGAHKSNNKKASKSKRNDEREFQSPKSQPFEPTYDSHHAPRKGREPSVHFTPEQGSNTSFRGGSKTARSMSGSPHATGDQHMDEAYSELRDTQAAKHQERHPSESRARSFLSNLSSKFQQGSRSRSTFPPVASSNVMDPVTEDVDPQQPGPYDHARTASMPGGPASVTSSQRSRQTRAPTVSTAASQQNGFKSSEVPQPPSNHDEDPRGYSGNRYPGGVPQHRSPSMRSKLSSAFSRVRSGFSNPRNPRSTFSQGNDSARAARSPYVQPAAPKRSHTSSVGSSARDDQSVRTYVESPADSQSTVIPPASRRSARSARSRSEVPDHNSHSRGWPMQDEPTWGFENLEHSRVRPPSGLSVHAGSHRHSKDSSRRTISTNPRSRASRGSQSRSATRADSTLGDIEEDEVSEAPYMGYVRPERGRKKCHHEGSQRPSYCSSTTSAPWTTVD